MLNYEIPVQGHDCELCRSMWALKPDGMPGNLSVQNNIISKKHMQGW